MAKYQISFTEDALEDLKWFKKNEQGEHFVLAKVSSVQSFYVGTSDDFDEEIKMTRANKNLMKFLDKRGEQPKKGELIPMKEVEKRLGLKKLGRDS